jgi:hypothetical protein
MKQLLTLLLLLTTVMATAQKAAIKKQQTNRHPDTVIQGWPQRLGPHKTATATELVSIGQSDTTGNAEDSLFTDIIPYDTIMNMDTTGMGQYGIRIYDPRIGRYMPMDASFTGNLYGFNRKKPLVVKKKKPIAKPAPKK